MSKPTTSDHETSVAAVEGVPTREEVVEALRQVLADLESGKLRRGSWREQYVASAIGLIASGCYAEAATQ
jgi:hypothetical protein